MCYHMAKQRSLFIRAGRKVVAFLILVEIALGASVAYYYYFTPEAKSYTSDTTEFKTQNSTPPTEEKTIVVDTKQVITQPVSPLNLSISVIDINQPITEYDDQMVIDNGGVYPPEIDTVSWWSGGGRPGAVPANTPFTTGKVSYTTYLYGHATNSNAVKGIFNDLGLLKVGDEIVIDSDNGSFSYVVNDTFTIKKSNLVSDSRAIEDTPGRLLLISCAYDIWGASNDNIVVVAQLKTQLGG